MEQNLDHPYREPPPRRALRRAQFVVYGPLAAAMTVMVLVGFRMGLSIHRLTDAEVNASATAVSVLYVVVLVWIACAIGDHSDKGKVARWLIGCGMSLILGGALGSWP